MLIRIVKDNRQTTYQCTHCEVIFYEDNTEVQVLPQGRSLVLPYDGDTLYIMNDKGDTTDTLRWPPKGK